VGDATGHVRQPNVPGDQRALGFSARFWVVLVPVGIGAGLGAIGLMALLRAVQHVAYDYRSGSFLSGVLAAPMDRRVVALGAAGLFAGLAWWVLRRVLPHGVGLLESVWQRTGELPLVGTFANAVVEMTIVGLGASLGREGAPKDAAAALASKVADLAKLAPAERRFLVACGAGAGLAAVYNVPLGGALFALEVLLGSLALPLVLPALAMAGIATAVSWLGLPNRPVYSVPPVALDASIVVFAVVFGPLAGIVAVAWVRLIAWSKAAKPKGWRLVPSTTLTFLVVGLVALAYPQILGNGLDLAELAFSGAVSVATLAALCVLRPLATGASLRSGALGGLLTPTLCFGAVLGGLAGSGWAHVWPGAPTGSLALLGAVAMLAAAMQAPLTAAALLVELTTHGSDLLVPGLVILAGASLTARFLDDRSIYSAPLAGGRSEPIPTEEPEVVVRPIDGGDAVALGRWAASSGLTRAYGHLPAEIGETWPGLLRTRTSRSRPGRVLLAEAGGAPVGLAVEGVNAGALDGRVPVPSGPTVRLVVPDVAPAGTAAALVEAARIDKGPPAMVLVRRQDRAARRALGLLGWSERRGAARPARALLARFGVDPPWLELWPAEGEPRTAEAEGPSGAG